MGDTTKAISTMKEAVNKFPNDQNIQVQLINYYLTHGQINESLNYLDQAIEKIKIILHLFCEGWLS